MSNEEKIREAISRLTDMLDSEELRFDSKTGQELERVIDVLSN